MTLSTALLLLLLLISLAMWIIKELRSPRNDTAAAGYWIAAALVALALIAKELP